MTARMGRPPKHPEDRLTKLLSVRLGPGLYEWLETIARKEKRTVSAWIGEAISEKLERDGHV